MKIDRFHIAAFVAIAALVWWITLTCQGTPVTWEHGRPFTAVVSVLVIIRLLFDRFLWHCPCFHGGVVKRPDLRGTWEVVLKSSYIDPITAKCSADISCYVGVEQTLSELKMHLMTPKSESWSIASHVRPSPSGNGYQVICFYTNEPNIHLRHKRISEMHNGALIIDTHGCGVRPDRLTAKYWTDRKTVGTMDFNNRVDRVFTNFDAADQHFRPSQT